MSKDNLVQWLLYVAAGSTAILWITGLYFASEHMSLGVIHFH